MNLVSTKTDSEAQESPAQYDGRPRIYLDDDIVEKLGLKGIPEPGTVFALQGRVVAERVTASAEEADEVAAEGATPDVSLCLILTDVGLQPVTVSDAERARALYDSEGEE